jgi:hypothetical protein
MAEATVVAALAAARLRALRTELLPLHRAVLDYERGQYEMIHGAMGDPHEVLRIVMHHEWFEWLRPLVALIVQMDERLAVEEPVEPADVEVFRDQIRDLLQRDGGGDEFRDRYQRALQGSPDVVVTHGRVMPLLAQMPA